MLPGCARDRRQSELDIGGRPKALRRCKTHDAIAATSIQLAGDRWRIAETRSGASEPARPERSPAPSTTPMITAIQSACGAVARTTASNPPTNVSGRYPSGDFRRTDGWMPIDVDEGCGRRPADPESVQYNNICHDRRWQSRKCSCYVRTIAARSRPPGSVRRRKLAASISNLILGRLVRTRIQAF